VKGVNSKGGVIVTEPPSPREATKEKILEYISEYITKHGKGVYPHHISESLGITRQYVHELLKELIKETRILKRNGHYFVTDRDLADTIAFAKVMKMVSGLLISPDLIEPGSKEVRKIASASQSFNETFYREFKKMVTGISVSDILCESKFTKNALNEKYLYEFANRIGAFITYILLETMRPYEYNEPVKDTNSKIRKRNILADNLTRRAIDIRWLFEVFHSLLYHTDQVSQRARSGASEPWFFEAKKNEFDNLMKTFAKVYPGIYHSLEEYWRNETFYSTNALDAVERYAPHLLEDCNHQWQKIRIYKLEGDFYYCLNKCHLVINEIEKKTLDEQERKMKKTSG
jgi:hypothetical protein